MSRNQSRTERPHTCSRCGGPCRVWAGSTHGWTCRACLEQYLSNQRDQK
ncbi:Uncharacterised protein [Mycobacteroides abscessus subsp. abscessus]|nr:Uncharacterised protein [Mycobacteroides abscessus subsp. abscessus]